MRGLRQFLSTGCWGAFLALLFILGVSPALQIGAENIAVAPQSGDVLQVTATPTMVAETPLPTETPAIVVEDPTITATLTVTVAGPAEVLTPTATPMIVAEGSSVFEISLAELGYGERTLESPYSLAEYTLRLPEGWELGNSFFDLDLSYTYNSTGPAETQGFPSFFGDIVVVVDGQTQLVFPIEEAALEHLHLRVDLPSALLNDPARTVHNIAVTLNADYICEIPHRARLIIHPTSLFSLGYDQLPITADLALYPRPFYQRSFEPDQVRFVLPAQPTEMELAGAVAVAAKLGDLTSRMVISGTTAPTLMDRLEALKEDETFHEHMIVIGRPEGNEVIMELAQLDALPVSLRERQLSLAGEGPAVAAPGSILTYTLTLTNTTDDVFSSLSLVDTLPAHAQLMSCTPLCSEAVGGETSWTISSLEPGEMRNYTLELRLSETITDSAIENTVTLLDATSGPLNVSTLTTTVRSTPPAESGERVSTSSKGTYLFVVGERAVPENDGVVQELVSPWDQTRAILILTGLSDEAVYKASQAMSFESYFPGTKGSFALVREVHSLPERSSEPQTTDMTFADLGYDDRILTASSQDAHYYFDIPFDWRLTEGTTLDLRFSHSQLLDYSSSFLSVLFNDEPVATIALSDETALNGELKIKLPSSLPRFGQGERISVHTSLHSLDKCVKLDIWLLVSSTSRLHLEHEEQNDHSLSLDFYPDPFDRRSDLVDVLFVLPPEPRLEEWEETLHLAAALGNLVGGSNLAPAVATGDTQSEKLANYHLIAIGRPLRNPVLQQVNAQLPQPFRPGSDEIEQHIDEIVFRLPPGLSLGFVQLLSSPWNEARAFLAVTGTTNEGVRWAMDVLAGRPWVLRGNLALIREDEVNRIDTRELTSSGVAASLATAVPEMTPVATKTATVTPIPSTSTPGVSNTGSGSDVANYPAWLIPLIGVNGLLVLGILAFAIWRTRRERE